MEAAPSPDDDHPNEPDSFHCLELFDIPPALASGTGPRYGADHQAIQARLISSRHGPFEKDRFAGLAPISALEELVAMSFLFLTLGMPLVWFLAVIPAALIFGGLFAKACVALATAALALHPLPRINHAKIRQSILAFSLYKYFSYRFVWKGDLHRTAQEIGPWLGAGVPHGVLPFANILTMLGINSISFLPNVFKGAPASIVFRTPFLRYLLLLGPACDVGARSLERELKSGTYVGLVPDGIAGIFKCTGRDETVFLKNRKGLAKLALRTGCAVLPAYSMGNTEAFTAWFDPFGVMEALSRRAQASIFFYTGRFGLPLGIPRRTRITVLVGDPIIVTKSENPTQAEINEVHERILRGIQETFDTHKGALGWGHKRIKIV